MDINNLTLVENLTLNACKYKWLQKRPECHGYHWHDIVTPFFIGNGPNNNWKNYGLKRKKLRNHESWINRKAYELSCQKLAYPKVKLPDYTKSQALAEARGVIEWVKSKYQETILT